MSVSIIIPAYNEADAIQNTLNKLIAEPQLNQAEIIVINDGSSDTTAEIVLEFERVVLLNHAVNRGYGASIVTGIRKASYPYVIWFDADGQHRIQDLLTIADNLINGESDYCIGVRDNRSHTVRSRAFGKWVLSVAVQITAGQSVVDYNSGLRGFKREVILKYVHLFPHGFSASTTSTLIMLERGYIGEDVPIVVQQRIGESSVNQVRDGLRILTTILRIFLLFKPLLFFGSLGITFMLIGFIYGMIRYITIDKGFPVFAALIIILGMQALITGLLADQISALRREKFE
ncbi:MAG: glycosyltransferase family 2 protein [Anaerolineae bacterium]